MGEEESSKDSKREESFAKTVNLDEPQLSPLTQPDQPSYSKENFENNLQEEHISGAYRTKSDVYNSSSSSRTKVYFVILGLILAALTAVFFIIPRDKKGIDQLSEQDQQKIDDSFSVDDEYLEPSKDGGQLKDNIDAEPGNIVSSDVERTTNEELDDFDRAITPSLSSSERELITSTWLGVSTVNALTKSLSSPNNFTLITYHGNHRFFAEFLSPSSSTTNSLTETIQQNVSPLELKTVSQSNLFSNGKSTRKVLVVGKMDERAALLGRKGSMNRMTVSQFPDWIKELAQTYGLQIKRYTAGPRTDEYGEDKTPIQIHFGGSQDDVTSFLSAMIEKTPSISLSKIIVSPSDRRTLNSNLLDLVMHFGFVEML